VAGASFIASGVFYALRGDAIDARDGLFVGLGGAL